MGNDLKSQNKSCKDRVQQVIHQSQFQIQRFNPFSKHENQTPYAQPLQSNIFAGTQQQQNRLKQIILKQPIQKPQIFEHDDGYQYDQKFFKKQNPNVVIHGHWYHRKPHGLSTFYFPGGKKVFIAYFNHGKPIYQDCLIVFQNGAYYHGALSNFQFHGHGKYVDQNKTIIIQGQWNQGKPVGRVKETLNIQNQILQFEGQFNQNGQRQGDKCSYLIKEKSDESKILFDYKGNFKDDCYHGQSIIKTQNGKYTIESIFDQDKIQIKNLQTQNFNFKGFLDRNFNDGKGNFQQIGKRISYQGNIHNGMLHGNGLVYNQDGSSQKVVWFQGLKFKHLKNFDNDKKFKQMIDRIQQAYQKANTYTQLVKILTDQYKQIHSVEAMSPRSHHQSYVFQMLSRDKVNNIIGASKIGQQNQQNLSTNNPSKHQKKQLVIELQKGKFLYVTSFKISPDNKTS